MRKIIYPEFDNYKFIELSQSNSFLYIFCLHSLYLIKFISLLSPFFLGMEMYLKATFLLKCLESIKCHFVMGNFMLAQNQKNANINQVMNCFISVSKYSIFYSPPFKFAAPVLLRET